MDLFEAASKVSGMDPPEKPIEPEVLEETPLATQDPFDLKRLEKSLLPYQGEVEALVTRAYDHIVENEPTKIVAVDMASQLSILKKSLDATRKKVIAPYDEIVRGINKMVKGMRDPIDKATGNIKNKLGAYAREQAEIQRRIAAKKAEEEAAARRKEMEKRRKEALEKQRLADEEAARKQAELDAIAKKEGIDSVTVRPEKIEIPEIEEVVIEEPKAGPTKTDIGTMSTLSVWDFEILNIKEVPREYLELNHSKVKAAIKNGIRNIPGLQIFEDTQVRIRTK
jgi:hypothetical protein